MTSAAAQNASRLGRAAAVVAVAVTVSASTWSSSAHAAVQLGELPAGNPDQLFASGLDMVQDTVGAAPDYRVPAGGGVITSWQLRGHATTPGSGRLQLWLPSPTTPRTLAARSDIEAFAANTVNSFPTRIPVAGGEQLGLRGVTDGAYAFTTALAGDVIIYDGIGFDPAPGEMGFNFPNSPANRRLNVAATLEPDADADGFGDETQDACPADASTQAPCADVTPPDTTIVAGPQEKTKKTFVTFEFVSSEPGSDFECSFDGAAFRPCVSPEDEKVGKGRHEFDVRAVDTAGNADASPAADEWRVRKKRKRG